MFLRSCVAGVMLFASLESYCPAQSLEWSAPTALSDYAAIDGQHDRQSKLASDGQGTVVGIWQDKDGILGARSLDEGQTWTNVFDQTRPDANIFEADITYAGQGTYVAMWTEKFDTTATLFSMRSTDNGQNWSSPVEMLTGEAGTNIDLASNGNGVVFASNRTRLVQSFDYGEHWTVTTPFGSPGYVGGVPHYGRIAYNGAGKWVHVYNSWDLNGLPGGFDAYFPAWYVGVSTDGTSWTKTALPAMASYEVAASGDRIGISFSADSYNGPYSVTTELYIIKSLDGGISWQSPAKLSSSLVPRYSIAASGDRWLIMGEGTEESSSVHHVTGLYSTNAMDTWTTVPRGASVSPEAEPSAAVSSFGNFVVSYSQYQKATPQQIGPDWDIKADRFQDTWTTGGFVNSGGPTDIPTIEDTAINMDSSPDGTVVAVWQGGYDQSLGYANATDIFYARSDDTGHTWSNSAPLNSDYTATDVNTNARVLYVGGQTWFAHWYRYSSSTPHFFAISTDNGVSWTAPAELMLDDPHVGALYDITSNQNGMLMLSSSSIAGGFVWRSTDAGDNWTQLDVDDNVWGRILHSGGSSWVVLGTGAAVTEDDGQNWEVITPQPALNLADMGSIVSDHHGTVMAISAGTTFPRPESNFEAWTAVSHNNGRNWAIRGLQKVPHGLSFTRYQSSLAALGGGKWVAAWNLDEAGVHYHAWAALSDNDGDSWGSPEKITSHVAADRSQELVNVTGAAGKALLAWNTGSNDNEASGPYGHDSDIMYVTASTDVIVEPEPPKSIVDISANIKLNFAKADKDSLTLSGGLPVSAGFEGTGLGVLVNIGGIERSFTLDSKGKAKLGNDAISLKVKSKKGLVEAQTSKFKVSIKKTALSAALQDEGLVDADIGNIPVLIKVTVQLGDTQYAADVPMLYTAKAGKSGKAKN